jgi:hypothetical protein
VEAVIENEPICPDCGDDLPSFEGEVSECATCAWFAATFHDQTVDIVAEQIRLDDLNEAWARDAERFYTTSGGIKRQ